MAVNQRQSRELSRFDDGVLSQLGTIRRIGYRLLNDRQDLDDFTQEVVLRIYASRDRLRDVRCLTGYVRVAAQRTALEPQLIEESSEYLWRGNVRELPNESYRAVAIARDGSVLRLYHFSNRLAKDRMAVREVLDRKILYDEKVRRFRRQIVGETLRECNLNHTQTVRLLGMERSNLIGLIERLGIGSPDS